jgi:hypothetical protein
MIRLMPPEFAKLSQFTPFAEPLRKNIERHLRFDECDSRRLGGRFLFVSGNTKRNILTGSVSACENAIWAQLSGRFITV